MFSSIGRSPTCVKKTISHYHTLCPRSIVNPGLYILYLKDYQSYTLPGCLLQVHEAQSPSKLLPHPSMLVHWDYFLANIPELLPDSLLVGVWSTHQGSLYLFQLLNQAHTT